MSDKAYVYFVQGYCDGPVKIGITSNISNRLKSLQTANPTKLYVIGYIEHDSFKEAAEQETFLHQQLKRTNLHGEWFKGTIGLLRLIADNTQPYKKFGQEPNPIPDYVGEMGMQEVIDKGLHEEFTAWIKAFYRYRRVAFKKPSGVY